MARGQDVLDELAAWYSMPGSSAPAGLGAAVLPSPFAPPGESESLRSTAKGGLAWVVAALLAWHDRARQRRALLELSDHVLRDIGISRAEAQGEAAKPFWRG
jgi:uncharacterized protein YjiS (DUF1127 family)